MKPSLSALILCLLVIGCSAPKEDPPPIQPPPGVRERRRSERITRQLIPLGRLECMQDQGDQGVATVLHHGGVQEVVEAAGKESRFCLSKGINDTR